MKVEGLFHVHSDYSGDGRNSIAELAAFCRAKGFGFLCLNEHSPDMTEEKWEKYVGADRS